MMSDALQRGYTHARWGLLLRGLIALALGIFIIARPIISAAAFALVIAIWALIIGISEVANAIEARATLPHWWLVLLAGLVSIAFSVAAFANYPGLSLAFAVIWTAWWLLVSGFFAIYVAIQERRLQAPWGWTFVFGILGVVAGIYAIMTPGVTLAAMLVLIATFAILGGIFLLAGFFQLGSAKDRLADVAAARSASTSARAP